MTLDEMAQVHRVKLSQADELAHLWEEGEEFATTEGREKKATDITDCSVTILMVRLT